MNITDIRVRLVNKEDAKLKAVASITIDNEFVVHDIKLILGKDGLFIQMPNRKSADGQYKDICHPISTPVRENIKKLIIDEYNKVDANNGANE